MAGRFGRRSFFKSDCPHCGKSIAGNMMIWHQENHCKPYLAKKEAARVERLHTAPVLSLNLGEAREAGRLDEFKEALDRAAEERSRNRESSSL